MEFLEKMNPITFIIGFLVIGGSFAFVVNKLLQNRKNRIATEQKRIFDRYEKLQKGMTKKEVIQLFAGLKPSINKKDRLEYKYAFRTKFNKDEGQKIVLFFEKQILIDIKLYDTDREWHSW